MSSSTIQCVALSLLMLVCIVPATAQQSDYDQLKAKIEAEEKEPVDGDQVSKEFDEYIYWLGVKAGDRDLARDLAAKASMAGNPYLEKQFLDLMELAQESGESTLWMADYLFLGVKHKGQGVAGDDWQNAVSKSDLYGKPLFRAAQQHSFDAEYVRESVRCLVRFALADVEAGYVGLYDGRELRHGTQQDAEGNWMMPDLDYGDPSCLPRSAFHLVSKGRQGVAVDEGLANVEKIREIAEWFELYEYNEGTELMDRFLADFLCIDRENPEKSLRWYLELAQKYRLERSEQRINGFYGTLHGRVEVQQGDDIEIAPGAKVQIRDGDQLLNGTADAAARYAIDNAPLYCKCPPFPVSAEYEADRVDAKYVGQFCEPKEAARQKKDLVIPGTGFAWIGSIELQFVRRFACDRELEVGQLGHRRLLAGDEEYTNAALLIGLTDFDFPATASMLGARIQHLSGEVTLRLREDHFTHGYAERTECFIAGRGEHDWVVPGNWNTVQDTRTAHVYRDIEPGMLNLMVVREDVAQVDAVRARQEQMAELQQRMQQALQNMDRDAMEQIKQDMRSALQSRDDGGDIPLRVTLTIQTGSVMDTVYTAHDRKAYDVCLAEFTEQESRSDTVQMPVLKPLSVQLSGDYLRGEDGRDRIVAEVRVAEPFHAPFRADVCPDGELGVTGSLYLERVKP